MRHPIVALLGALAACLVVPRAQAQLMASERGTVSQTVDGTTVSVEYYRPRARGRTGLFGTRIHWGEVWTPGANQATALTASKDVTIDGHQVPKGKYSVWMVVTPATWELVLDPDTSRFHTNRPKPRAGQVRFPLQREKRPFMEVLTWWFPEVSSTGMTLAMQWDTVYVPLRIGVPRSFTTAVTPAAAQRIVGRYQMRNQPMPAPPGAAEAAHGEERPPAELILTIRYEGGELRGVMDPPLFTTESGYKEWVLVPVKGDWYYLARVDGGELVEVVDFAAAQFDASTGRATGFELRARNDMLIATGKRLP